MSPSALFGQPAANEDDYYTIVGFARVAGIPDEMIHPEKGFPLHVKPSGPDPYNSRQGNIIAAMSVLIVLIIAVTGTRLWLRLFRRDLRMGLDDLFIVIASLGAIAWFGCAIGMAKYGGAGKHIYAVTYKELWWYFRFAGISQVIFWVTVGLANVSITCFNRRLTGLTSNRWQCAHITFLILLTIFIVVAFFVNFFVCRPLLINFSLVSYGRNPTRPKCLNWNSMGISLSVVHIIFQFSLLSVPLVILYVIKMNISKKIRLAFLFSIASIACIGAVMRQVIQKQENPDKTRVFEKQLAWSSMDIFATIIAASLPVLNAAIPARWRSPSNSVPQLANMSILKRSKEKGSVRLNSNEIHIHSRADGTIDDEAPVDPEHGLVEKDSFTRKTEKRWDEAFEVSHHPDTPAVGTAY